MRIRQLIPLNSKLSRLQSGLSGRTRQGPERVAEVVGGPRREQRLLARALARGGQVRPAPRGAGDVRLLKLVAFRFETFDTLLTAPQRPVVFPLLDT